MISALALNLLVLFLALRVLVFRRLNGDYQDSDEQKALALSIRDCQKPLGLLFAEQFACTQFLYLIVELFARFGLVFFEQLLKFLVTFNARVERGHKRLDFCKIVGDVAAFRIKCIPDLTGTYQHLCWLAVGGT